MASVTIMRLINIMVLSVCLAGCGLLPRAQYSATGYDGLPLERGLAECRFEAEKAQAAAPTREQRLFGANDVFSACMRAKGFHLVAY